MSQPTTDRGRRKRRNGIKCRFKMKKKAVHFVVTVVDIAVIGVVIVANDEKTNVCTNEKGTK